MIETFITLCIGITIFIIKSYHDYLHTKNINNGLHKKIDNLIDVIDVIQTKLPQQNNDVINNALLLEEKLLNDNNNNNDNENKNK